MTAQPRRIGLPAIPLADMIPSWTLSLEAENKSANTIRHYTSAVAALHAWTGGQATTDITTDQLRAFLAAELDRGLAAASVASRFRYLRVFFTWLTAEEPSLMPASPMRGLKSPAVPRTRKPPLADDDIRRLLAACKPDSFEARRDIAIIRVLIDTGMRVGGLAGLTVTDVHLSQKYLTIILKGGDETAVPIGKKTVAAIDKYLRARVRHSHAARDDALFLGLRGGLRPWGIENIIRNRAEAAGVEGVHPHRFRRTFSQKWLAEGGTELDLMKITGWKTREMIDVYAGEIGEERARAAHARLSIGDRI